MPQQRIRRIFRFLDALDKSPVCDSRETAFALVKTIWLQTTASDAAVDKARHFSLSAEHGWQDLDKDPCYLKSVEHEGLCLFLHQDGAIIIQDIGHPKRPILLTKIGKPQPMVHALHE